MNCACCGGLHDSFECGVQTAVAELLLRFGYWRAPLDTAEGVAYLDGLGFDRQVALTANGRWAADNDA